MIVDASNLMWMAVSGAQIPSEGPKTVPIRLDFSAADSYSLDLSQFQHLGKLQLVQAVFIDASQVDVPVAVTFSGGAQTIVAKGRTQGYYVVLASNPVSAIFTCIAGGALVNIALLNFPVCSAQWATQ
jgi:hypothetical protein